MKHIKHLSRSLALHTLADGDGTPLLLLHAAAGSSRDWPIDEMVWPGPIYALDFSGHGDSDRLVGGGYLPELYAADADHALAQFDEVALAGAGLGAFVALLLAGARPDQVRAVLLLPGEGLMGGGASPEANIDFAPVDDQLSPLRDEDPLSRMVEKLVRPPEYSAAFGVAARAVLLAEDASPRPPWWEVLRDLPNVTRTSTDYATALSALVALVQ